MKRRRALLFTIIVALALCAACGWWLRGERQQYARNRALIKALTHNDTKTALALVNAGAAPNTRLEPTPAPTLPQLLNQFLRRSPPPANDSPTAFLIACGTRWRVHSGRSATWADVEENLPLLQAMLAHGANVQARSQNNGTALYYAVIQERLHTVELLLQHGAGTNVQYKHGYTPLMYAVGMETPSVERVLLTYGANPNMQTVVGETALHYAINSPIATSVIPDLLAHGADPNLRDKNGQSPLQLAQQVGYSHAVRLLKRAAK